MTWVKINNGNHVRGVLEFSQNVTGLQHCQHYWLNLAPALLPDSCSNMNFIVVTWVKINNENHVRGDLEFSQNVTANAKSGD